MSVAASSSFSSLTQEKRRDLIELEWTRDGFSSRSHRWLFERQVMRVYKSCRNRSVGYDYPVVVVSATFGCAGIWPRPSTNALAFTARHQLLRG